MVEKLDNNKNSSFIWSPLARDLKSEVTKNLRVRQLCYYANAYRGHRKISQSQLCFKLKSVFLQVIIIIVC